MLQNLIEQNVVPRGLSICPDSRLKKTLSYFCQGFYYCHLLAYLLSSASGNYAQGILSEASNSMMLHTILGGATVRFPSYSALLAASVWEDSVPELWV